MGLLARSQQNTTPSFLAKPSLNVANSTQQTNIPQQPIPLTFAQKTVPKAPTLSGPTTLSKGKVSLKAGLLNKIPSTYAGDILKGVINAPETLAKEAGLLDEDQIVKLDRLAQSLIKQGTDPKRAYEIAGMDLQKSSLNPAQSKGATEKYKQLAVTPEEEKALGGLTGPRTVNSAMTGLALSNIVPGAGAVTKKVGTELAETAGKRVGKQSIEELQQSGLLNRASQTDSTKPLLESGTIRTPEELVIAKEKLSKKLEPTPQPTKKEPLSPETKSQIEGLKAAKEALENTGFKSLQKYESKRGEFKGELNTNNGTGKFAKQYDTTLKEVFNDVDNKYTTDELKQKYEDLKGSYKRINDQIKTLETRTSAPRPEIKPEMGGSTATKAEETLSQVPTKYRKEILPFEDSITKSQTPVNDKINIIDYLRTPDRVLEKIGFGDEAKQIRKSYEAYTKELPKNIDKITEWSKEVPKESNEKIFKYLDGQKIELSAKEEKVAGEIKNWLKEWATRLKLPADNQITHYITHIFDKELVKKEFDEDLAKLITERLPGQVYDPFLEKRLGAMGYKQDTWAALDAYVKRATRKANMDPALEAIRNKAGETLEMSKIETSQFKYLQRYINNVNMRPTELDNLIDNTLKGIFGYKYGTRPVTYLTKLLRQMTFRGMLGLNPGSALRNLSQGINTYAKLGEKHTVIGYAKLFSPHARQEVIDSGILADNFIQDRTLSSTKKAIEKVDKGLFALFDMAEKINRGAAYLGAKSKYMAEHSKELSKGVSLMGETTIKDAEEYAKKIVRDTQFTFGSVDTPVALQNDIVKTLLQFQTYTVKQIEFLTEMAKNKEFLGLLRYGVSGLIFVNTVGKAFGMDWTQLIPSFRFDTPPSLKLPVEVTKAVLNTPNKYNQPRDLKTKLSDIGKSSIGLFPAGSQIKKSLEGFQTVNKGGSFDKGGNLQFEQKQTLPAKIQSLAFGKYVGENAQKYFDKGTQVKDDMAQVQPIYDQIQKLKQAGKNEEAIKMYDSLGEKGKTIYKKIKSAEKAKQTVQLKQDILPTFQKIRGLKEQGNTQQALSLYNSLSDDEKKAYQLLKKQLAK